MGRQDAVVWLADGRATATLDYGVRLRERLEARGLRVRVADMTGEGCAPVSADLHVMSGGGTSVTDLSGWMREGLDLTRWLIDGAQRGAHFLLGVCLGSQMIAEALWPGSVRAADRLEVGLTVVNWRCSERSASEPLVVPRFHYEEVDRKLVERGGARVVAESPRGGVQGFRLGERLAAVQFHPELTPTDLRQLLIHHRQTIEEHRGSVDAALRSVDGLERRWSQGVFDHILDQVWHRGR